METVVELTDTNTLSHSHSCEPEVCRSLHMKYQQDMCKMATSPWHGRKTIFLLTLISLMAIWIVLFATAVKFELL